MLGYIKTLLREADIIIAINIRFGEMTTDGFELSDLLWSAVSASDP